MATGPSDAEIEQRLGAQPEERWRELWSAVDQLERDRGQATWRGGRQLAVEIVDGVERPVFEMPYVVYSDEVERVMRLLVQLGVVFPFEWPAWQGRSRYRGGRGLDGAPVAEAARLLSAIVGAERFCDGTVASAFEDGSFEAALVRLRRWQDARQQA